MNRNIIQKVDEFEKNYLNRDNFDNIDPNNIYSLLQNVGSRGNISDEVTNVNSNDAIDQIINNDDDDNTTTSEEEDEEEEGEEDEDLIETKFPTDLILKQKVKEAQLQWEESLKQLHKVVNWILLPILGKFIGRKLSHFVWQKFMNHIWN